MVNLLERWIKVGAKTTPWMYEKVGSHFFEQKRYKKVEELYLKFNKEYPKNKSAVLGLIKVARIQQNWELALKRLEDGIQHFPDEVDFYFQKINILSMLNETDQSKAVLKLAKERFPNQLHIILAESRMLQKEYGYEAAQVILDYGVEKFPEHLDLSILQGYNYWLLGAYQKAENVFDRIRPKLNLKQGYLPHEFAIPYINLLLKENRLRELKLFFEEVVAADIWNWEIVYGYCQLLMSRKEYNKAIEFIQELLAKKESSLSVVHQFMLDFELEKNHNIVDWEQQKVPRSISNNSLKTMALLDKLMAKLESIPTLKSSNPMVFELMEKFKAMAVHYPSFCLNTAISPTESYNVASSIIQAIQNKKPFSLIRLGDGEGSFLPYREDLKGFQEEDQRISQQIWWGNKNIDEIEWSKITNSYTKALQEADILGVPGPMRCIKTFLNIAPNLPISTSEARGLFAIFNFVDRNWDFTTPKGKSSRFPLLTSCHIHSHLTDWNLWDIILNEVFDCSVISCHEELVPLLKKKYQIDVQNFYKIPSEYKYAQLFGHSEQKETPHYPDRFEQISKNISVKYPGEVFIVAAGFLGKIYCNIIKQKGGIALDAGSAVDYWLDYKTRVWTHFPISINYDHVS